jgi:hypothetical protein
LTRACGRLHGFPPAGGCPSALVVLLIWLSRRAAQNVNCKGGNDRVALVVSWLG